jgi:hypothetical protein
MQAFPRLALAVALTVAIALTSLAGLGLAEAAPVQSNPDFSGKWRRDVDRSDDAEALVRAGLGVTEKTTGRPDVPALRTADRLVQLSQALDELEIKQTAKDFRIYDDAGNVRIYYIDGKKHPRQTPWGASLQTETSWQQNQLHMHTEGKDIGKVKVDEFYALEGTQMVFLVRIKAKNTKEDVVVRTYYNRVKE